MDSYHRDGLNYLPILTQQTMPSCRSRINLFRKRDLMNDCNGNYEGDSSMFGNKRSEIEYLHLLDSESDTEYQITSTADVGANVQENLASLIWRFAQFLILKLLKPELREKISIRIRNLEESCFYNQLSNCAKIITILLTSIFVSIAILCKHLSTLGHFFWEQRFIFHQLVRSLLWRLTLAKCTDLALFFLILLSIPILLILSLIGLFISLCGCLKDTFQHYSRVLNTI